MQQLLSMDSSLYFRPKADVTVKSIMKPVEGKSDEAKTKLLVTLGPAVGTEEMLLGLFDRHVRAFRLDLTSGDEAQHVAMVKLLDKAATRKQAFYTLVVDIYGPDMQVLNLTDDVTLTQGAQVTITTDQTKSTTAEEIAIRYPSFEAGNIAPGAKCYIGRYLQTGSDATSAFLTVHEVYPDRLVCVCANTTTLIAGQVHTFNMAGFRNQMQLLSEKDKTILRALSRSYRVPFVATGCRNAKDYDEMRTFLDRIGMDETQIMCKIDSMQGFTNFKSILEVADAIVLARGKLGLDVEPERMVRVQKTICSICNRFGKPIIVTRVVDSMEENPRPTRAEATDVANLVLDGADCIMLGAETYRGKFPWEAVEIVSKIAHQAEQCFNAAAYFDRMTALQQYAADVQSLPKSLPTVENEGRGIDPRVGKLESIARSAVRAATQEGAQLLVVFTGTGRMARLVAKYKPPCPVIALVLPKVSSDGVSWRFTGYHETRRAQILRGVYPITARQNEVAEDEIGEGSMLEAAIQQAVDRKLVAVGEMAIVTRLPHTVAVEFGHEDVGELLYVQVVKAVSNGKGKSSARIALIDPSTKLVQGDGVKLYQRDYSVACD